MREGEWKKCRMKCKKDKVMVKYKWKLHILISIYSVKLKSAFFALFLLCPKAENVLILLLLLLLLKQTKNSEEKKLAL